MADFPFAGDYFFPSYNVSKPPQFFFFFWSFHRQREPKYCKLNTNILPYLMHFNHWIFTSLIFCRLLILTLIKAWVTYLDLCLKLSDTIMSSKLITNRQTVPDCFFTATIVSMQIQSAGRVNWAIANEMISFRCWKWNVRLTSTCEDEGSQIGGDDHINNGTYLCYVVDRDWSESTASIME